MSGDLLYKRLARLNDACAKKKFYFLQFFVVLTALLEVVSVFSIGPFMALVGNLDLLNSSPIYNAIYLSAGEPEPYVFLFWMGLVVLFSYLQHL